MKDLFDRVNEGILDDVDDILDKADKSAYKSAAIEWLKAHGCNVSLQNVIRYPDNYTHVYSNDTWHLDGVTINITDKDKEIPEFIKIDVLGGLNLAKYKGKTIPDIGLKRVEVLSIRNCPNLTSLKGCPENVKRFAVSGCPKITSLDGCPKKAEVFKATLNGKQFSYKEIQKVCDVPKNNIIF